MSHLKNLLRSGSSKENRGAARMFARDVQTLAPVWSELTTSEARRVIGLVEAPVNRRYPALLELEGALAVLACLLTGRRLKELHQSHLTISTLA